VTRPLVNHPAPVYYLWVGTANLVPFAVNTL
jgi:hypothetical protein